MRAARRRAGLRMDLGVHALDELPRVRERRIARRHFARLAGAFVHHLQAVFALGVP